MAAAPKRAASTCSNCNRCSDFSRFVARHYREAGQTLDDLAAQTDKGIVPATALVQNLRSQSILLPSINVIERICAEALTRGTRRIHTLLTESLTDPLDGLLNPCESSNVSAIAWLRQSPGAPSARHMLEHIERLNALEALTLPEGIERQIHQNRLLKLAREGAQMTAQHLRDLETTRRYAALVAVVLAARATVRGRYRGSGYRSRAGDSRSGQADASLASDPT